MITLKLNFKYKDKNNSIVIYKWTGGNGDAIFQPLFEPSFQDCFYYKDGWQNNIVEEIGLASREEREGRDCDY